MGTSSRYRRLKCDCGNMINPHPVRLSNGVLIPAGDRTQNGSGGCGFCRNWLAALADNHSGIRTTSQTLRDDFTELLRGAWDYYATKHPEQAKATLEADPSTL